MKNKTFEQALDELRKCAEKIKDGNLTLDESIELYDQGIEKYKECQEILEKTKQKITFYGEEEE